MTHPFPKDSFWIDRLLTDETKKVIAPQKIMKKKKVYDGLIRLISSLEEKYDDKDTPPIAIYRRQVAKYLRKHIDK